MKNNSLSIAVFVTLMGAYISCPCMAKNLTCELSCDRDRAGVNQPFQLNVTFNDSRNIPAPELPAIDGFQARYLGRSTRKSVIHGRVSSSITHMYALVPTRTGSFVIGPFTFAQQNDSYTSNSCSLEVTDGVKEALAEQGENLDVGERLFMVIQANKNKAYINEAVPVSIKLYVNKLGIRDIRLRQVDHEGLSLGRFYNRPFQYREDIGGVTYDVIEFKTTVFGSRAGEFKLGPATLQCNLIMRKESQRTYEARLITVKSPEITLTVLQNKPFNNSGGAKGGQLL